jgi:transposase-like protein
MNCPKCHNNKPCKDSIVHGSQRYKCKSCNYRYTVEKKSDIKSPEVCRLALEMYLEGMGFRSIGRILKISYGVGYQWIKK